ncbi:hypothetical protein [Paraburkholderia sp. BL10I2N1]|uniref:hypothetical protein n=1 Tax=Paraburkholderia sp. BL10I2N1 TaxID=1938796 RepID=UPI00105F3EED|nr:hypothetical protein [Paraburkholderia sp. BL10I2N1]
MPTGSEKLHGNGKVGQRFQRFAIRIGAWFRSAFAWLWTNADPVSKWAITLGTIAAISGATFAYYQFKIAGGSDWAVNLSLSTEVVPYQDNLGLLVVHVRSTNARASEVDVEPPADSFKLTVKLVPDGLASGNVINPDDDSDAHHLIPPIDLLPKEGYVFAPGADFEDVRGIVVPLGSKMSITAKLIHDGDDVSASSFLTVEPPASAPVSVRLLP